MDSIELSKLLAEATPGPWRVVIDDDGNPLSGRPSVFASEELDCGIVHWDGFVQTYWRSARGDKEIQANGRLIAAAPTIAADNLALRDVVRELVDALQWALCLQPGDDSCDPWVSDARAAIAKAEGVM